MAKQVAIVLNTRYHVETAVSVYFTLSQMKGWEPALVPLLGDRWGLYDFLKKLGVRVASPSSPASNFEKAILVTSGPQPSQKIPAGDHPLVKGLQGRRILICHKCNIFKEQYHDEKVICLSPLCLKFGLDYVYQCENPLLDAAEPNKIYGQINFLVQGHLKFQHRNFHLLAKALKEIQETNFRILLVGEGASMIPLKDPRVLTYPRLNETQFYSVCREAHFILPLIDPTTRSGTYVKERFTSSYGISFASTKPLLTHQILHEIYPVPSFTYRTETEFLDTFIRCTKISGKEYSAMFTDYQKQRELFRSHNMEVLNKYLSS